MNRSVLIADDNTMMREMLKDALSGIECSVREAPDGDRAVAELEREVPAVLLLDLFMPGKSGLDVLRFIKDRGLATRVFVVSSMDSPAMAAQVDSAGAHGFIAKPFHPLDIQTTVTAAFEAFDEASSV